MDEQGDSRAGTKFCTKTIAEKTIEKALDTCTHFLTYSIKLIVMVANFAAELLICNITLHTCLYNFCDTHYTLCLGYYLFYLVAVGQHLPSIYSSASISIYLVVEQCIRLKQFLCSNRVDVLPVVTTLIQY